MLPLPPVRGLRLLKCLGDGRIDPERLAQGTGQFGPVSLCSKRRQLVVYCQAFGRRRVPEKKEIT